MERPGHRHRQGRPDVHPPRLRRRGHRHRRGDGDRGDGLGEEGGRGDRRDAEGRIITFFRGWAGSSAGTRPGPTDSSDVPSEREHHVCELTLRRTGVQKGHRSLGKMLPLEPKGARTCLNGGRILLEVIPILSRS